MDTQDRTEDGEMAVQAAITETLSTEARLIIETHLGTIGTVWSPAKILEEMRQDHVIEKIPEANGEMSGGTILEREERNIEEKDEMTSERTGGMTFEQKEETALARNGERISAQIEERMSGPKE